MKHLFYIASIVFIISCKQTSNGYKKLDFVKFKLEVPKNWFKFNQTGIDSYVGGLTNGRDSLFFEYGLYSVNVGEEDFENQNFGIDTINGLVANFIIPKSNFKGYFVMTISVNDKDNFSIYSKKIFSQDTVIRIFKSVQFKESDTTINGHLSKSIQLNKTLGSGKTIFLNKCAMCHAIDKKLTGPPLQGIFSGRDYNWVYRYFKNPSEHFEKDKNVNSHNDFETKCIKIPDFSEQDAKNLLSYFKCI